MFFDEDIEEDTEEDTIPLQTEISKFKKVTLLPKYIIMDIYGVITSWGFADETRNYLRFNMDFFLYRKIRDESVVRIINKLREQANIENRAGIQIPLIEESDKADEVVINSVVDNVFWQMDNKHRTGQIHLDALYTQIWSDAYKTSRLKVHIFEDIRKALEHWCYHMNIKIYSYAAGAQQGQKFFLSSTVDGDISHFFVNYINSSGGYNYDPNKFRVIIAKLRQSDPKNILYFADDPRRAKAAIEAGVRAIVVLREGNFPYTKQQLQGLVTIKTFEKFQFHDQSGNPIVCCSVLQ